jgi:hypothetical protein
MAHMPAWLLFEPARQLGLALKAQILVLVRQIGHYAFRKVHSDRMLAVA